MPIQAEGEGTFTVGSVRNHRKRRTVRSARTPLPTFPGTRVGEISLRSLPVVVPEHPAESLVTLHVTGAVADIVAWIDQSVVQALVISFGVVMREVLGDSPAQRPLAEEDHLAQALFLDRPDESLDPSIEVRGAGRKAKWLGSRILQQGLERIAVLSITIDDDESLVADESIDGYCQVEVGPGRLAG